MLRLNIRQTQAEVAVRRISYTKLEAHATPAQLTSETKPARSNRGTTPIRIDIDSYPSRHSYGYDSHTDFAKEHGQQGFADVRKGISEHTEQAWTNIDQAARPDSEAIPHMYKADIEQFAKQRRVIVAVHIPDPVFTVHPSEVVGTPEPAHLEQHVSAEPFAKTHYTPGKIETYLTQKAGVQQWTSEGRYDIMA